MGCGVQWELWNHFIGTNVPTKNKEKENINDKGKIYKNTIMGKMKDASSLLCLLSCLKAIKGQNFEIFS